MSGLVISEAGSVQFPMIAHAADIGWTPIAPKDAEQKRGGVENMLFRDEAEAALAKFNPWMTKDSISQVADTLEAQPPTIEGNRRMLSWLRGEMQWHDENEECSRPVRIIDFDSPGENVFHVTWEWRLKPPARKGARADAMFVINGVPVCIVEDKNPKNGDAVDRAVVQLKRYEAETPELLGAPQLFNVTHMLDYWYGVTWNASRRFMARWKEAPEETYKFAVQSFFEPVDFLRTLRDWILFYVEDGETQKSVLRQHQRAAIDKITERCRSGAKKRGLIWHTQGSGKTFTLLTAARLILEQKERYGNATVIVVADRTELEGQLSGWIEKLLGEMQKQDIAVKRAESKEDLQQLLLDDRRGLILSMIHKFEGAGKGANKRGNIYVFIDEAHRSVAKDLGTYLMAAVPNAVIIGFTGTPINKTGQGQGTFKIFGAEDKQGYLHKYSIRESIDDETTVPVRHTMAPSDMLVPAEYLDKEFLEYAKADAVTDIEELNKVLERAVNVRTFLTADDRVKKTAAYAAEHFKKNVYPLGYKAFFVGVDREACARYKAELDKHLPPEWSVPVYTENANDVVERPLAAQMQISGEKEEEVRRLFKKPDKDPRILIVTDKLLTGYDAKLLYCMYLDKPMRDHVLLQAVARVNRPYINPEGFKKPCGLVIDFVGVLREMKKALKFDSGDVSGVIEDLDLILQDLLRRLAAAKAEYLTADSGVMQDAQLEALIYGKFLDAGKRKKFFQAYKDIEMYWEIISPDKALRDHIPAYKQLAALYAAVRNAYQEQTGFLADLAQKTRVLVQGSAVQKGLGRFTKSVSFDAETLESLQNETGSDEGKVMSLLRGLNKEISDNPDLAPVYRTISERAEKIKTDLEDRKTKGLVAMDMLKALAAEKEEMKQAHAESGLSEKAFAVFWTLKEETALAQAGVEAQDIAGEVETLLGKFPNADVNPDEKRHFRAGLYPPLKGLATDKKLRTVGLIMSAVFRDEDGSGDG